MTRENLQLLIEIILALGGISAFTVAIKSRAEIKKLSAEADKSGADAAQVLANTAVGLLPHYREEVAAVNARLDKAHLRIRELEQELEVTKGELSKLRERISKSMRDVHPDIPDINIRRTSE